MAGLSAVAYATVPEPVRPAVLAYPSPTSVRFVILVVATLFAGLFAGNWVHNVVVGDQWQQAVATCLRDSPTVTDPADALARQARFATCTSTAERTRALFSIAGLLISGLGSAVILYAAPAVLERRRRLRPAGPNLAAAAERIGELAATVGLRRAPTLMVGSAAQKDAFCYGVFPHYRMVLPKKLAIQPRTRRFEALVAHELAHVARRDVTVAWLAKSVGYAIVPVLAAPVVLAAATGDFSVIPDYTWRALTLGAAVMITRAAILRSRELDADLWAARHGSDVAALSEVVESLRDVHRGRWRRLLANHPSPAFRRTVLHQPAAVTRVGLLDGLAAAFLAALTPPLVELAVVPLFTGTTLVGLTDVVAALIAGPLVGGTVGLALWRASLVRRITGVSVQLLPVTVGVFAGYVLGGAPSLAQSAVNPLDWDTSPLFLAITGLCLAGATVTVAGLGELWADAAGRLRTARASWVAAVMLPGILFAVALWAGTTAQKAVSWGGWELLRLVLPEYFSRLPVLAAALVLATAAGWAAWPATRPVRTPAWLLEAGPRYDWPQVRPPRLWPTVAAGVAAGLAGAVVLAAFRAVAGSATGDAEVLQRFYLYVFVAATSAVAAGFGLAILDPGRGAGSALLAVPIACLAAGAGFLALNTFLGGNLAVPFVTEVLRKPVGLALLGEVLFAGLVMPALADRRRPVFLAPVISVAVALLATTAVVAARDSLAPVSAGQMVESEPPRRTEQQTYREQVAPAILQRLEPIIAEFGDIEADSQLDPGSRAEAVRQRVVVPLRRLLIEAEGMTVTAPEVSNAHRILLAALQDSISAYEFWATAAETRDPRAQDTAFAYQTRAVNGLRNWAALVQTL